MNLNSTATNISAPDIKFHHQVHLDAKEVYVIGRKASISLRNVVSLTSAENDEKIIGAVLNSIKEAGKATTFLSDERKLTLIALPAAEKISRNNHTFSPHEIADSLDTLNSSAREHLVQIFVVDKDIENVMCPTAAAIARAMPLYQSKSSLPELAPNSGVSVAFYCDNAEGEPTQPSFETSPQWRTASAVCDGVRLAAQVGDMPPAELNPDTYALKCQAIANEFDSVTYTEIKGDELRQKGYGGIMGVGMGARCPPRMIIMTHSHEQAQEHIALCGKGVVYDTGGLALKSKQGMCGMKHDCGGSAGVLGGFVAAVKIGLPIKLTLILAVVENAIGPDSFRNDDILTMKSGKTVEINNTDAEGRLILADCVSHASNQLEGVDLILNMATLTGAQCITTGSCHAGIMTKTKALEERVVEAGLKSGDLTFPMLYAPELLRKEFKSSVADMKNSVANRMNAQASCAGHFIESHIDEAYEGDWCHCDMAGPQSTSNGRATGYGVALILGLCKAPGFN